MSKSISVGEDETVLPDCDYTAECYEYSLKDLVLTCSCSWQLIAMTRVRISISLPSLLHDDLLYITTVNVASALTTTACDRA
jgi:hypothetical protein